MANELTHSLLVPVVELLEMNEDNMLLHTVKQNHECLMNNNQSLENEIVKLVNILGGIDIILQQQLSKQNAMRLTTDELHEINNLLISVSNSNKMKEVKNDLTDIQSVNSSTIPVNERNTFLHGICCKSRKPVADAMINYIFGKCATWIWGILMMILVISTILEYSGVGIDDFVVLYKNIFTVTLTLPFCIIWVLSLNIVITKQIMKQFEFWFKFYYFIKYWICSSIYDYRKISSQQIIGNTFVDTTLFLLYVIYCFVDGLKLSPRFKGFVLFTGSVYMTVVAVYWTFLDHGMYMISVDILNHTWNMDIKTFTASSVRTVVVFMWKQTLYSWYKPNRSTYLKQPINYQYSRKYTS